MMRIIPKNNIQEKSGNIKDKRMIVALLYHLMRDHLPTTTVEQIVKDLETSSAEEYFFYNGWLAQYCQFLADRLEHKEQEDSGVSLTEMEKMKKILDKGSILGIEGFTAPVPPPPTPPPQREIRESELPKKPNSFIDPY